MKIEKYAIQVILQGSMTFTFTKAYAQMVSRLMEMDYEEYKEAIVSNPDYFADRLEYSHNIQVCRFVRMSSEHEQKCDYEGAMESDEECECKKEYVLIIKIRTTCGVMGKHGKELFEITMKVDTTLQELISKVNENADRVYYSCSCGAVALQGKSQCRTCYIYSYDRTDAEGGSCAVCYENGGLWAMVKHCKHVFHMHCLDKCEHKCPLCRHEFEHYCSPNGVIINPYM